MNGKKFDNQPINSAIKQYKKKQKLTMGQGEDYTTGYFLDYDYIRNNCRLTPVDASPNEISKQNSLNN